MIIISNKRNLIILRIYLGFVISSETRPPLRQFSQQMTYTCLSVNKEHRNK